MFQLVGQSDEIKWPVKVPFVDGSGKTQQKTFIAFFPRLPQSEIDEIVKRARVTEEADSQSGDDKLTDDELAKKILIGWDEVTDDQGQPVEFSPAMRDKLLEIFPVRPSVISAWFESISGQKRKN
ncbi:hypothetical protein [Methylomonas sp. ZR1]|uniref:hypothetical protein n=1 Tax=Methylomonas sp. ZR1 TaxID=1797072 RepID=UPI00149310FA|nr:hypothetical protein [Methylomonas sp. ZR1]NOV29164.1 hypothetical protein [Methylomonas sp. ZR1]